MIAVKCIALTERERDEIMYGFIAHSIESFIKFGTTVDTEVAEIVQLFKGETIHTEVFLGLKSTRFAFHAVPHGTPPLRSTTYRED